MKMTTKLPLPALVFALLPFVSVPTLVTAQVASSSTPAASSSSAAAKPIPKSEVVTLDAFEVKSDSDIGYTATNSLAGGRIDTPLKDTPSAITILTSDFLDDIAATDLASAAMWAPDSLPVGDAGTTAEFTVNTRGLGGSFPTRNYFRWYVASDSYNTERLEFARGPNSILFGDGNPGGITTTWTKQALLNTNRGKAYVRVGGFGGYRATLDYNFAPTKKFAVRLNLLNDTLRGWRDYDLPNRWGVDVAITYRISQNTQFRAEFEQGHYRRFAYNQTFNDQTSLWDGKTIYNGVKAPSTKGTGVSRLNTGATADFLVYDPSQASLGVLNWKGSYQTTGTNLTILPQGRDYVPNFPSLPSREFSAQPKDAYIDTNYRSWTGYLEQNIGHYVIGQLAYNHQDNQRPGETRSWGNPRIDVNEFLPNGQPNRNFLKVYSESIPQRFNQQNTLSDVRLSFAWKQQFSWINPSVSLISGYRQDHYNFMQWQLGRVNGPIQAAGNTSNQIRVRQYWDQPQNPGVFSSILSNGYDIQMVENSTSDEHQKLYYTQLASSTTFLDGKLSLLVGLRFDTFKRASETRIGANPDGTSIVGGAGGAGVPDLYNKGVVTKSAGVVYFPISWLGAFFNYSDSFNAPGNGAGKLDGSPLPPSTTSGIDVGVKFSLAQNKLVGSIDYYRTKQKDRALGGTNVADINDIWDALGLAENEVTTYRDTQSYRAHGLEFDFTANPLPGWRILFNYSIPKTEQENMAASLRGYVADHLAQWQAGANSTNQIDQSIQAIQSQLGTYAQGRTLDDTMKYIANIYSNYSFRKGSLKGFSIGGGVNFRGKQLEGNVNNQPFDYLYTDAYYLVSANASYAFKWRNHSVKIQLNVSNLLDNDNVTYTSFIYNAAYGDVPQQFRYQTPRQFLLTTTVSF